MLRFPRSTDSKDEKIITCLTSARQCICFSDDKMLQKAQLNHEKVKKRHPEEPDHVNSAGTNWIFQEYMDAKQYLKAWDELVWASQRVEAMIRLGGGNLIKDWDVFDKAN